MGVGFFRKVSKTKFLITIFLLALTIALIIQFNYMGQENKISTTGNVIKQQVKSEAVKISYDNMVKELAKVGMIKDLPEGARVVLEFYNFDSGVREIEKRYFIEENKIREYNGEEADIVLSVHSKYLDELTNKNVCSILAKANKNKDLGIDFYKSKAILAWKYRSMTKYSDCL